MSYFLYAYRTEVERLPQVSIFKLKKSGVLSDCGFQNFEGIMVTPLLEPVFDENNYRLLPTYKFTFRYWISDGDSEKEVEMQIDGVSTTCRYGGKRWWFVCPQASCQRRVGTLYVKNGVLACRECLRLCYASQNENRRMAILFPSVANQAKIEKLDAKIKRRYYNGKPTRLQRRLERLINLSY